MNPPHPNPLQSEILFGVPSRQVYCTRSLGARSLLPRVSECQRFHGDMRLPTRSREPIPFLAPEAIALLEAGNRDAGLQP